MHGLITEPDSPLVSDLHPSPNVEPRLKGLTPSILVLHYTGLPTVERALDVLSRVDCKVSCHYVVDVDGRIIQMVPEALRAWHAGLSYWSGETDINSASIGIEIQNPGHANGYPEFPAAQIEAVAALSRDIVARHGMLARHVLAHSDIAPGRKIDPGEKFDWKSLADRGVGLWVPPADIDPADDGLTLGSEHASVAEAQRLLTAYGYKTETHGVLDEAMQSVIRAFQLHFRSERPDGRLDASTLDTLARLVAATQKNPQHIG
jgi:N-acetylmuramoyl-L-alanine amidase